MIMRRSRDPFRSREALSLRRAMDQLLEQSFVEPGLLASGFLTNVSPLMAPMDVCETANGYEIDIAIPGVRPEDIELTVDQNTLTIRGHYSHQDEHEGEPSQQQGQQQNGGQQAQQNGGQQSRAGRHQHGHSWLVHEITSGVFERTITLPRTVDTNNIQTKLENGILTVSLPISEESRPKRLSISGGQSQPQQVAVGSGQQQGQ